MLTAAVIHNLLSLLCNLLGKIKSCVSTSISSLLCGYFNLFPPSRHQQLHITLIEGADSELNCVFSTQLILKHTMTFYIYEEYMKAAVAQPDPSLKPRAAHTHSESSARGGITREGQPRHKSPDSHRDCPRSTALYGPEGFWVFFFFPPTARSTNYTVCNETCCT